MNDQQSINFAEHHRFDDMYLYNYNDSHATHLSNHPVPLPINVFSMPPIGHEVKVVGKTHNFRQSLEDVDAKAFAAVLHGPCALNHQTETIQEVIGNRVNIPFFSTVWRCFMQDALTCMGCLTKSLILWE